MVRLLRQDKNDLQVLLGDPKKAIISMFLPFFIAFAVVEVNQFVDTFWVSGLGNVAAEAVSTVVPIYGLIMCIGVGLSVGATTTISFALGQGRKDDANRLMVNSVILGIMCALAASVMIFALYDVIIDFMGAGNVRKEGWDYLLPYVILSPGLLTYSIIGGTLRGEGAARKSTIVQISAALINMALDPVLIYGLNMGVMGAGLATALSSLMAACIGLYWYFSGKTTVRPSREDLRFNKDASRDVLGIGGPKTVQSFISNMTDLIQRVFLIVAGGTSAAMFYNYTWRYIGMVNLPTRALDSAMIPVCSASYGQDDLRKMRTGYIFTMKLIIVISIIAAIFLFVFAEPLMSIMTTDESMKGFLEKFVWTLRVGVFLIPFSALMGIESSMLQVLKKAKVPMYFYMLWGFVKLGLYALSAYGLLGVDPYEGIIYCMVAVHVWGGLCLLALERHFYRKAFEKSVAASAI